VELEQRRKTARAASGGRAAKERRGCTGSTWAHTQERETRQEQRREDQLVGVEEGQCGKQALWVRCGWASGSAR
jgi:hypothetical protein